MKVLRTKTFISTNAELLDEKVNNFLEKLFAQDNFPAKIEPFMGVTSVGNPSKALSPAYFVGVHIEYYEETEVQQQLDIFQGGLQSAT